MGTQTITNHAQIEFSCLKLYNGGGNMYECASLTQLSSKGCYEVYCFVPTAQTDLLVTKKKKKTF